MDILGNIVKKSLTIQAEISALDTSAVTQQKEELKKLLLTAKDTAFGLYHNFHRILSTDQFDVLFRAEVPLTDYRKLHERWWVKQQTSPHITWPGHPDYFALSSGTTGKTSKRIPITDELLSSMRSVSLAQLGELSKMDLPPAVFSSEALAISSSAQLNQTQYFKEGEISGINVFNLPDWYEYFFRPGADISQIDDWEERTDRIAKEASNWDIGVISGIPSWVQLCLQKIIDHNNIEYIDDLWPNIGAYLSGGVAFGTYEKTFRALFRKEITVVDTYLASEGYFAYGSARSPMDMKLAIHHGYFYEFIPFDQYNEYGGNLIELSEKTILIDDTEEETEYVLVVSSCSGLWRYIIGDVIKFTDKKENTIRITGRTKFFLNVVGSQLSEEKMDDGIWNLSDHFESPINEYTVSAVSLNGIHHHVWTIVTDDKTFPNESAQILDKHLQELNKNYKVARKKALAPPILRCVTTTQYQSYLEETKKIGGQIKIPKIMDESDWKHFNEILGLSVDLA